jgi:beta-glucanase (GH16 family)
MFPYLFIFSMSVFLLQLTNEQPPIPVKGYSLVWQDEFNGVKLDRSKWDYRGTGKRENAFIDPRMVKLDGKGFLVISAASRNDSILTGMIATEHIREFTYGYFECRAKFARTPGTISAFWLQSKSINGPASTPETNGAEIDIAEYFPHASKTHVFHTLHWGGYNPEQHRVEGPVLGKLDQTGDDFHVVGLEWYNHGYTLFVDGKVTYSGNQFVSHVNEFIVLSLGVNELSAGPLDKSRLPDQFIVDYIRVYQKK